MEDDICKIADSFVEFVKANKKPDMDWPEFNRTVMRHKDVAKVHQDFVSNLVIVAQEIFDFGSYCVPALVKTMKEVTKGGKDFDKKYEKNAHFQAYYGKQRALETFKKRKDRFKIAKDEYSRISEQYLSHYRNLEKSKESSDKEYQDRKAAERKRNIERIRQMII